MFRKISALSRPGHVIKDLNTKTKDLFNGRYTQRCLFCDKSTSEHGAVTKPGESQEVERFDPTHSKPLKNVPFVKELFLGRYNKETLVYPELRNNDEFEHLNEMVAPIEKFFNEGIDSKQMDIDAKIPEETLKHLGELGLFGQQIPEEYGGLGLNATSYARLAEVTALDGAIAVTLAAHQAIGLKGILIAGTDEQKAKYLPKLATGEHIAAFCLTEPSSGSDAASIQTRATLSKDGTKYYLNGGKIWISNGGIAEVFTVFAKTEFINDEGVKKDKVTAFIVERGFGGITSGQPEDKLGIRASNTCEVHFDNTPVPVENVIGEVGGGFKIAMNILNSGRFSMGSSGAGILKRLIAYTVEHALTRKQFNKYLAEFGQIQEKFAKMAITTYAMESMAYLCSQTIDAYQEPDMSLEAAMVKMLLNTGGSLKRDESKAIFSSEGCWDCANECLQILGGLGYMKSYPYERYLRDARILMIFEGTNEILRMYIALTGAQYAGKELKELVSKLRNPLQHPSLVLSNIGKFMSQKRRQPKMTLHLDEEVHPKLKAEAIIIERASLKFEIAVQHLFKRYGKNITEEQFDLKRLADIAIDIYAMTACVGRCSRSICLGLKNCEHEFDLTRHFCRQAHNRIEANLKQFNFGPTLSGDENTRRIAETIFENNGYAATHPLAHNF